jgi:hypothetical protein
MNCKVHRATLSLHIVSSLTFARERRNVTTGFGIERNDACQQSSKLREVLIGTAATIGE